MPFDIGLGEWVVVAIIALIVVGPEDLPKMFRKVGNWVGRARSMSDEFRRTLDGAVDDSGIKTIAKDIKQTEIDLRNAARMEELEESARELENDIKGEFAQTNSSTSTSLSRAAELENDRLDEIERQEAKARAEAIRAKADAIKAEARAKMLREQLEKAESELASANAKVSDANPSATPKTSTKAAAKKPVKKATSTTTSKKAKPSEAAATTTAPKARSTKSSSNKKTAAE